MSSQEEQNLNHLKKKLADLKKQRSLAERNDFRVSRSQDLENDVFESENFDSEI